MRSTLLNQLLDSNGFFLMKFDEELETPPYVRRPVRMWVDTPKGRIQFGIGACEDYSFILDSTRYMALCNAKLIHDAYEYPNDFVLKLIESFKITEDSKIEEIFAELGIAEMQLDVYKDSTETERIEPSAIYFAINGKEILFNC